MSARQNPATPAQTALLSILVAWTRRVSEQTEESAGGASIAAVTAPLSTVAATTVTPKFVQVSAVTPQTSQSSVAAKYTSAQSAGNTNVVAIGWNDATSSITSVADSAGNIYQVAVPTARGAGISQAIYYAPNIEAAAAGTNTVTVTFNTATSYVDVRALEYSGLDPVSPFDVGASAAGTGTTAGSPAVSTSAANELVFGAGMTTGGFIGAGTGFASRIITAPDADIAQDRLAGTAGSYSATASLGASSVWLMQVAAFKAVAVTGTPDTSPSSVSVTAPGSPVSGTVTLSATAADNVGVAGVQFLVDGTAVGARDTTTPYAVAWNSAGVANGTHTLTARATDASGNTTLSAPVTITVNNSTSTTPPIFVGDYSTGNFSQWAVVQNKYFNSYGKNYTPQYPATIVNDPVKGEVARFEVRQGDYPGFVSGDRSEVQSTTALSGGATEGQTSWYSFSTKFGTGFPQNHADLGWGLVNQWHASDAGGSPPLAFIVNGRNGYLSLMAERQSAPGQYLGKVVLWQTPLNVGTWHDFTMEVTWSASDTIGSVRLWQNGVAQTLTNGQTTYKIRTLVPGGGGVYYKEGYYRQRDLAPTGVVYHGEYRVAATQAGLRT